MRISGKNYSFQLLILFKTYFRIDNDKIKYIFANDNMILYYYEYTVNTAELFKHYYNYYYYT